MSERKERRKNLNPDSYRNMLKKQRALIDAQLAQPTLLNKQDLVKLLDFYLEKINEEYAENTVKVYGRYAKDFIKHLSDDEEKFVKKSDVNDFKKRVSTASTSTKTINTKITSVNKFLHFCDLGALTVEKAKTQDENFVKDRIYDHEYTRMVNKSKALGWMELHYLIKLMGRTGIRVGERDYVTVEGINRSSLDFEVFNKGKWRTVPLPQDLARELRRYAKSKRIESGPIFDMNYHNDIYGRLKTLAGMCRVKKEKVKPHAFRHYFGFKYIETNGTASITNLADILGHSSVETTRIYGRGTSQDARRSMERMK